MSGFGAIAFAHRIEDMLGSDRGEGQPGAPSRMEDQIGSGRGATAQFLLDFLYGFDYLSPRYSLTYDGQDIGQLSPGERGLLLLVFYLLVDEDDIPIVIDQPEENLDNQTIYKVLVRCIKRAKERRQVIMVTHNPNRSDLGLRLAAQQHRLHPVEGAGELVGVLHDGDSGQAAVGTDVQPSELARAEGEAQEPAGSDHEAVVMLHQGVERIPAAW